MNWWERMLGRTSSDADERQQDTAALSELRESFDRVRGRTDRLEAELKRINADLRRVKGKA